MSKKIPLVYGIPKIGRRVFQALKPKVHVFGENHHMNPIHYCLETILHIPIVLSWWLVARGLSFLASQVRS